MRTSHRHRRHAHRHGPWRGHHPEHDQDFDTEDEMTPPFPPFPPVPPQPPFGFRGHRRGGRKRRGDVRAAVLALLGERAMHGYEMIQEIAERSGGMWKPSPGSVYPTLQLLADEGLVRAVDRDGGKRLFELTDSGRAAVDALGDTPPWERATAGADPADLGLRGAHTQLTAAVMGVAQAATTEQKVRAAEVLDKARRELYSILGEG